MKINKNILFLALGALCCNLNLLSMGDPLYDSQAAKELPRRFESRPTKSVTYEDTLDEIRDLISRSENAEKVISGLDESIIRNKGELLRDIRIKISKLKDRAAAIMDRIRVATDSQYYSF